MGHSPEVEQTVTREELLRVRGPGLGVVPLPVREPADSPDEPDEPHVVPGPHGTRKHYEYGGCRCDECKAANAVHKAKYR